MSKIEHLSHKPAMNNITHTPQRAMAGVRRQKKLYLRIDMTPMVDLGFLLIAFFVMTTQLSLPAVMKLMMPKDGPDTQVPNSAAFTILIENESDIYVYTGNPSEALQSGFIQKTSLAGNKGLRELIQSHQRNLDISGFKEGRAGMMMLIKPSAKASYQQIVDILDEAAINAVGKYVIVPYSEEDRKLLEQFASLNRDFQD